VINQAEADSLEYMYNGNTAIVSMQYSFLPSWLLSWWTKKMPDARARRCSRRSTAVRHMPEGQRPRAGRVRRKLGSFGGEAPFMSLKTRPGAHAAAPCSAGRTFNNTSGPT